MTTKPASGNLFNQLIDTNLIASDEGRIDLSEIYLLEVQVFKGSTTISISPEILGLTAQQAEIARSNGISTNTIKMFGALTKAAHNLENFRAKQIYPLLLNYDRFRFCHSAKLSEVMDAIQGMHERHGELKQMLVESYPEGKEDFRLRLTDTMRAMGMSEDAIADKLPEFLNRFPSLEQVLSGFKISVSGGVTRFPEKAETEAKSALMKLWQESIDSAMQSAIESTRSETLSKLSDICAQLRVVDTDNQSVKLKAELAAIRTKMQTLLDYDSMLADLAEPVNNVASSLNDTQSETLAAQLLHLQESVAKVQQLVTEESGTFAQAGYMLL